MTVASNARAVRYDITIESDRVKAVDGESRIQPQDTDRRSCKQLKSKEPLYGRSVTLFIVGVLGTRHCRVVTSIADRKL